MRKSPLWRCVAFISLNVSVHSRTLGRKFFSKPAHNFHCVYYQHSSRLSNFTHTHTHIYTGYKQKNGVVSKVNKKFTYICSSQWSGGLRCGSAAARLMDCGFESRRRIDVLSLLSFVCCQVQVSAPA